MWKAFSRCYSLISFECCVWVQRCVSLVDDSRCVCVCVCVCVCLCVEVGLGGGGAECMKSMFFHVISF